MTEYSCARGRGHQPPTGGRNIDAGKQPSPWPCVLMLALLVLGCLVAPRFWHGESDKATNVDTQLSDDLFTGPIFGGPNSFPFLSTDATSPNSRYDFSSSPDSFGFCTLNRGTPTPWSWGLTHGGLGASGLIDEFGATDGSHWGPLPGITVESIRSSQNADGANPRDSVPTRIESSPVVLNSLALVGATVAEYLPANILATLASHAVDSAATYLAALPVTPINADHVTNRSSLQLLQPGTPPTTRVAPLGQSSWCVPDSLFKQLQRLAVPVYTATWASHVNNQLHALTERDALDGDDVQSILTDLSEAAQEAVIMANNTEDDSLRVELLRAHWALARRLDCWAAMHDERVAYRFQDRVAARGELSPYFSSAPVDHAAPEGNSQLGKVLESYETSRDPQLARQITQQQRALAESPASFDRALADSVEQHYRNANMRIAITAEMVNRMIRSERNESRPVREQIAGAFVQGQSQVHAKNNVELAPAENQWRMKVHSNGVIESNTLANAGPVRLRGQSATDFFGVKSVIVRPDGVELQPSEVTVNMRSRLIGVTTDYDWVPMFGNMTRDRARREYLSRQPRVREQMEFRVTAEAGDTLDRETHEAMERVRQRVYERFTSRFDEYGIKLTTIEMKSSPERLVTRLRIASNEQLGSHTPRPRALSDSLASAQLHESALNNLAITLGLDGQRLTGEELQQKLRDRFPQMALRNSDEVRRDTVFQFVPKDSVQFRIDGGKLELIVAFESVELDGDVVPDVTVHASYVPAVDGLIADFVRDGALGIEGRISASERARMHNIFKTVFPPERKLRVAHFNDHSDSRLRGLMVTQLVLEDGWLGVAIGPEAANRVAERWRSLR